MDEGESLPRHRYLQCPLRIETVVPAILTHLKEPGGVIPTTDRDEVHGTRDTGLLLLEVKEENPFQRTIGTVVMGLLPHRTDHTILHITTVGGVRPHRDDGNEEDLLPITMTNEEDQEDHRPHAMFEEAEEVHSGEAMVGRLSTVLGVR
jgi:hypothetical protein